MLMDTKKPKTSSKSPRLRDDDPRWIELQSQIAAARKEREGLAKELGQSEASLHQLDASESRIAGLAKTLLAKLGHVATATPDDALPPIRQWSKRKSGPPIK